jgi:membrane fusion protein (multidrug efflux system)
MHLLEVLAAIEIFVIENGIAKLKKVTAGRILGDKVEILRRIN